MFTHIDLLNAEMMFADAPCRNSQEMLAYMIWLEDTELTYFLNRNDERNYEIALRQMDALFSLAEEQEQKELS